MEMYEDYPHFRGRKPETHRRPHDSRPLGGRLLDLSRLLNNINPSDQFQSSFFSRLPLEIRQEIYSLLLEPAPLMLPESTPKSLPRRVLALQGIQQDLERHNKQRAWSHTQLLGKSAATLSLDNMLPAATHHVWMQLDPSSASSGNPWRFRTCRGHCCGEEQPFRFGRYMQPVDDNQMRLHQDIVALLTTCQKVFRELSPYITFCFDSLDAFQQLAKSPVPPPIRQIQVVLYTRGKLYFKPVARRFETPEATQARIQRKEVFYQQLVSFWEEKLWAYRIAIESHLLHLKSLLVSVCPLPSYLEINQRPPGNKFPPAGLLHLDGVMGSIEWALGSVAPVVRAQKLRTHDVGTCRLPEWCAELLGRDPIAFPHRPEPVDPTLVENAIFLSVPAFRGERTLMQETPYHAGRDESRERLRAYQDELHQLELANRERLYAQSIARGIPPIGSWVPARGLPPQ